MGIPITEETKPNSSFLLGKFSAFRGGSFDEFNEIEIAVKIHQFVHRAIRAGGLRVLFLSFFLVVLRHFGVHILQLVSMRVNRVIFFEIRCVILDFSPPVSLFPRVFYKLCKQGHWFSFENKIGSGTHKCFKEITSSLKGWKKKFFLLDRRAILDAMPGRHSDTDLHDDFLTHFNEDDVARLSEFQLPTWTGTVVSKGNPLSEDQCPKPQVNPPLPVGAPIPASIPFQKNIEKPNPKATAAREKKNQQSLARAVAKRACTGATEGLKKKRRVQKNIEPTRSGSEDTLSATPLNQAIPETFLNPAIVASEVPPQVEKEVIDLSGNTRMSSPPITDVPPSPHQEHHDTHEIHSQSSHHGSEDEPVKNWYVLNWRLHNDLRVCTFHACKELVSHLATPTEDDFLGTLSNVEVIIRAYQTLGQSAVDQGELLKRHEQLNHDYMDLRNRNDAHLLELDHLRSSVRRTEQENKGLNNKLSLIKSDHFGYGSREKELTDVVKDLERERDEWRVTASNQVKQIRALEKDLEPKTYQLANAEERIMVLEGEKRALLAELAQSEIDRQKLIREFIPAVVRRLHTSVEYRKALAILVSLCYTAGWLGGISFGRYEEEIAGLLTKTKDLDIEGSKSWDTKHRELFAKQYPYVQKVADSYLLPMANLLRVSLDVPDPRLMAEVLGSTGEQANVTDPRLPPPHHEITKDTPFGTTTR
nr:hypothetical protein [Tanacetum cinerariifolium]